MPSKYFSTIYIYLYSILLALADSLTISRDPIELLNFETFSMRVLFVFTYWLVVKGVASAAEKRGYSYKLALLAAIALLPALVLGLTYVLLL